MGSSDFSAEAIIKSVTTDIASVTAADIAAIIEKANAMGKAIEMGDYLVEHRPDLEDAIEDAVGDALAQF